MVVVHGSGTRGGGTWLWHKGGTWLWHKRECGCGTNGGTWLWCMVVAQGGEHGCSAKGNHGCGTTWLFWHKGEHKWGNMVVMYGRNRVVVQGRGNMVVVRCGASGEHDCSARGEHCCGA